MQAQADFLDTYRLITNAATETLKVALRNIEQLNELQLQWVRVALEQNDRLTDRLAEAGRVNDLFLAQSQFAVSQLTRGIEVWWRLFRAMQDSQLAAMSRMEAQAGQATQAARRAYDLAVQTIQDAYSRGTGWSGVERRKAPVIPFTGPERRRAA
jgi:hypothetical protein